MGRSTWLELFSTGICERICAFVGRGRECDDLLRLVEACPSLHETVISSLLHGITICNRKLGISRRWLSSCGPSLRQVTITDKIDDEEFGHELSQLQIVRCAVETTKRASLQFIKFFTSVTDLSIITRRWPNMTFLFQGLSTLPLEKLEIFCNCNYESWQYTDPSFTGEDDCVFYRRAICGPEFNAFAIACPNLRVFKGNLCSCGTLYGSRGGFPFLEGFQRLEEYVVTGNVPIAFASRMPSITRINIVGSEDADDVHSFGTALTSLWTYDGMSRAQVSSLERCIGLKELRIVLEQGADVALPQLMARLPSLTKLGLRWDLPTSSTLNPASAMPGITLQTVRAAPKLTELYLADVQLPLHELEEVLKTVGSRLRFFETPIVGQEENFVERWEAVILLLVKYNPNLHMLYVDQNAIMEDRRVPKTWREIQRMERAMLHLREHLPVRRSYPLERMAQDLGMDANALPPD